MGVPVIDVRTGIQEEDVDEATAAQALQEGRAAFNNEKDYAVVNPDSGKILQVKGAQAAEAIGTGFQLVPMAEYYRQEAGDEGLTTFVEGAASSATLGLTELATDAVGEVLEPGNFFDPERTEARKEANPGTRLAGEFAGIFGGVGLAKAPGLAGKVGRALPSNLLIAAEDRAAVAAAKAVEQRIASEGAKRLARTVAQGAVGAGAAAVDAGITTINQNMLGPTELNAELVLSNMGHAAVFGGTLTGGFQGVTELADVSVKALRRMREAEAMRLSGGDKRRAAKLLGTFDRMLRKADEGITRAMVRGQAVFNPMDEARKEAAYRMQVGGAEGHRRRRLVAHPDETKEQLTEEVLDRLRSINTLDKQLRERESDFVAGALSEVEARPIEQWTAAANQIDEAFGRIDEEMYRLGMTGPTAQATGVPDAPKLKRLKHLYNTTLRDLYGELGAVGRERFRILSTKNNPWGLSPSGADLLDQAMRTADEKSGKAVMRKLLDLHVEARKVGYEPLQPTVDRLGVALTDPEVWGRKAAHEMATYRGVFDSIGDSDDGKLRRFFKRDGEIDDAKVRSYVAGFADKKPDAIDSLKQYREALEEYGRLGSLKGTTPETKELIRTLRKDLQKMSALDARMADELGIIHDAQLLQKMENQQLGGGAMFAGPLVGFAVGGLPGLAAGTVGMMAMRPHRTARARYALMNSVAGAKRTISDGVKKFVSGTMGKGGLIDTNLSPLTLAAARASSVKERRKAVEARIEEVHRMARSADAVQMKVSRSLSPLYESEPLLADKLAATFAQHMRALSEAAPRRRVADPLEDRKLPLNESEMRKFIDWDRIAAGGPAAAADALGKGRLTQDMVNALDAMYPEGAAYLRETVMEEIVEKEANLTMSQKVTLSRLLRVPLHPSLSPEAIRLQQQVHQTGPAQPGNAASGGRTPTQRQEAIQGSLDAIQENP